MSKPRLLDLFCGAGGAGMGYHRAGFDVVGVDKHPQPHYPFSFVRSDALEYLQGNLSDYDAIHASPPCQAFTSLNGMHNALEHEDMLTPTRELLKATGLPYVMENVPGAPMENHVTICGSSLRLGTADGSAELRRHRHFETNFPVMVMPCQHGWAKRVIGVYGGHGRDRRRIENTQDFTVEQRREAMGIDWMNGSELSQAIPPAYTEHIGTYLMAHLSTEAAHAAADHRKPTGASR